MQPATPPSEAPTPRAVLFRTLAILWSFPSLGALVILSLRVRWKPGHDVTGFLTSIPIEQWIAAGILIVHAWLIWRWRRAVRPRRAS